MLPLPHCSLIVDLDLGFLLFSYHQVRPEALLGVSSGSYLVSLCGSCDLEVVERLGFVQFFPLVFSQGSGVLRSLLGLCWIIAGALRAHSLH